MHKIINPSNWRTCSWAYSSCWHPAARWMTAKGTCATAMCSIRKSGVIVRGMEGEGGAVLPGTRAWIVVAAGVPAAAKGHRHHRLDGGNGVGADGGEVAFRGVSERE